MIQYDKRLLPDHHPLLAAMFAAAGYSTCAFTAGGFLSYEHGFHHGFDRYSLLDPFLSPEDPFRDVFPWPGDREVNNAVFSLYERPAIERWIGEHRDAPFFLFVHSYIVHNYHPPADILELVVPHDSTDVLGPTRDLHTLDLDTAMSGQGHDPAVLELIENLYDGTVLAADREVGALLGALEREGLLDNTIVVLTSDHGEEFGEHGGLLHGRSVYEEMLRVPLLLHVPGVAPQRVTAPVGLGDVAPTVLGAAGLPVPPGLRGTSLLTRLDQGDFREEQWGEVDAKSLTTRFALIIGSWKLIWNPPRAHEEAGYEGRRPPEYELFALDADPTEQVNRLVFGGDGRTLAPLPEQPPPFERGPEAVRLVGLGDRIELGPPGLALIGRHEGERVDAEQGVAGDSQQGSGGRVGVQDVPVAGVHREEGVGDAVDGCGNRAPGAGRPPLAPTGGGVAQGGVEAREQRVECVAQPAPLRSGHLGGRLGPRGEQGRDPLLVGAQPVECRLGGLAAL